MKKALSLGTLALLVFCFAWIGTANSDADSRPAAYSTEVLIKPAKDGAFLLRGVVKDGSSGEILAGPSVTLPAGQAGNAETTLPDGTSVHFTATVDGSTRTAAYTVTVKRSGSMVSEHSAKVSL